MQSFNFVMTGKKEELKSKPTFTEPKSKPMLPKKKQIKRNRTLSECSTDNDDADSLFTEIQENNFEYEDSDKTPALRFQETEKVFEIINMLKRQATEATCPCQRGTQNISDGKIAITQDFIDDKMQDL